MAGTCIRDIRKICVCVSSMALVPTTLRDMAPHENALQDEQNRCAHVFVDVCLCDCINM